MLRELIGLIAGDPLTEWAAPDSSLITGGSDLDREVDERYVKLVGLSKINCRLAEGSLEGIDGSGSDLDLYQSARLEKLVASALDHAAEIDDEFYRSAALHPVAELLAKAGQYARANEIIDEISVEFISEEAVRFLELHKKQAQ